MKHHLTQRIELRKSSSSPMLFAACAFTVAMLTSASSTAQDDRAAGLFTTAGQLPLVSQSISIDVMGAVARTTIEQEFANTADAVRQADYRLATTRGTQVVGFGFYNADGLIKAALKDKTVAKRDHARAVAAGRSTGLMTHDTVTHSFSVFPLKEGERKRVQIQLETPVTTVGGVASVRLPVALFLGQKGDAKGKSTKATTVNSIAPPRTPIVARITTDSKLETATLVGANATVVVARKRQHALIVGDTIAPVELQWRVKSPSLATHAYEVRLPNGRRGVEVAVTFADLEGAHTLYPRLKKKARAESLTLIVDASASMRSHERTLRRVLTRAMAQASDSIDVVAVADGNTVTLDTSTGPTAMARKIVSGDVGHQTSQKMLVQSALEHKCRKSTVRCVFITDGQLEHLDRVLKSETPSLVLANPDDVDREPNLLGDTSKNNVFVQGAATDSQLDTLVDEVTLPALDVLLASYGRNVLKFKGRPTMRVAEGGQRRFYADLPKNAKVGREVVVDVALDGTSVALKARVDVLNASGARGKAMRKRIYSAHLADMLRQYEKKPSTQRRDAIVALSLREEIPTRLTAWHVDEKKKRSIRSDVDTRSGRGGVRRKVMHRKMKVSGGATRRLAKTVIDFSDDSVEGDLVKPEEAALGGLSGSRMAVGRGGGGLGLREIRGGGGGTAFGSGGLGAGTGRGVGGLGARGTGVRASGGIDLGGRGKSYTRIRPGKVTFRGSLSREQITRQMKRHHNQVRYCYEKLLGANPSLNGRMVVRFMISADGRARSIETLENTTNSAALTKCVTGVVKRIRFPKPSGGGGVKVTYPFAFTSARAADPKKEAPKGEGSKTAPPK